MRMTAEELELPLDIIETVIGDSYKNANKAARTTSEIEISGFGTFIVSQNKIRRKIKYCEKAIEAISQREQTPNNVEKLQFYIELLEELKRRQK